MKHIEFETLLQYFEGHMSQADGRKISAHLETCNICTTEARKLENFLGYVQIAKSENVPQSTTANLLNIYKSPKSKMKAAFSLKEIFASLSSDDWQLAMNERYIFSDTRQLLYKAEGFDIDLRLSFTGEKCQVSGQIFPDCFNATAEIVSAQRREKVLLNQDCEFIFPPIENGVYDIRFNSGKTIIVIKKVSLLN